MGLSLIYWPIGFLIAISSLAVYLEYAANFPNRSGSEVVYLEQAYPRPKYFFPIAFAVQTVILSFSSGNSIGELTHGPSVVFPTFADRIQSPRNISVPDQRSHPYTLGTQRSCCRRIHGCRSA